MFFSNIGTKRKVLAIGAHPDDIELGAGGFLFFLKNVYNFEIHYLICTDGNINHLGKERIGETRNAARQIGVANISFLRLKDGNISHNSFLINKIEKVIRKTDPYIVISHNPCDHHQDHKNVGLATISTSRHANYNLILYPSFGTREFTGSNLYVDITDFFERKLRLISNFSSQKNNWYMNPSYITIKAMEVGFLANCKYAEEFKVHFLRLSA